jgi:hypothetical protein
VGEGETGSDMSGTGGIMPLLCIFVGSGGTVRGGWVSLSSSLSIVGVTGGSGCAIRYAAAAVKFTSPLADSLPLSTVCPNDLCTGSKKLMRTKLNIIFFIMHLNLSIKITQIIPNTKLLTIQPHIASCFLS